MRREMERREQERKRSPKVDFISGGTQSAVPTPKINLPIPGYSPFFVELKFLLHWFQLAIDYQSSLQYSFAPCNSLQGWLLLLLVHYHPLQML